MYVWRMMGLRWIAFAALLTLGASARDGSSGRRPSDLQLVDAAKRRDIAAVRASLRDGADVNTAHGDGSTALHWAAHWDDLATADLLIRAGANVNAASELGVTPLMLACTNGSQRTVDRLLEAGADPNAGPKGRETAVMVAAWSGNPDVVKSLLAHGGDPNAKETAQGQTALMWAASESHPEVIRVLVEAGADVHARTRVTTPSKDAVRSLRFVPDSGFTALLFASRGGDLESARILLSAGAHPNDTSNDGLSALILATVRGHPALATLLLEQGADPNADGAGYTALHWAAGSWETELTTRAITTKRQGEWYTVTGLKEGKVELVKALLAHGADPDARLKQAPARVGSSWNRRLPELQGATPLFLAAMAGAPDVMSVLMDDGGADAQLTSKARGTALMAAAGLGRVRGEVIVPESATLAAARLAVGLGADVNAVDDVGNSALHYAAYLRRDSIVQFLVDQGAKLDVKNKYGETPLWVAELELQPAGGGIFDVRHSSTGDVLRKLGARAGEPPYVRVRPADWPDIPACPPHCQ
jgi:ankyrin repeat protein